MLPSGNVTVTWVSPLTTVETTGVSSPRRHRRLLREERGIDVLVGYRGVHFSVPHWEGCRSAARGAMSRHRARRRRPSRESREDRRFHRAQPGRPSSHSRRDHRRRDRWRQCLVACQPNAPTASMKFWNPSRIGPGWSPAGSSSVERRAGSPSASTSSPRPARGSGSA